MERILPIDFYTNMLSVVAQVRVLVFYLEHYLPKLGHHFKEIGLDAEFFAV
jgi:hypothetical protein